MFIIINKIKDSFKGTFLLEDSNVFVHKGRTFYFIELENFKFGDWKIEDVLDFESLEACKD